MSDGDEARKKPGEPRERVRRRYETTEHNLPCWHGRLKRKSCKQCHDLGFRPSVYCDPHGIVESRCKICKQASERMEHTLPREICKPASERITLPHEICKPAKERMEHSLPCLHGSKRRFTCKKCHDLGFRPSDYCELHGRQKARCRECNGAFICVHNKNRSYCSECNSLNACEHKRNKIYCAICDGSGLCEHGAPKNRCKACKNLRQQRQQPESQTTPQTAASAAEGSVDTAGHTEVWESFKCIKCEITKLQSHFYDPEADVYWNTCHSCQSDRELEDETKEMPLFGDEIEGLPLFQDKTGGLPLFEDEESKIYCFDCRESLPASKFSPGIDVSQVTYCLECQTKIDHTPVCPCIGDCGRHVRPDLQNRAVCEECKARLGMT